MIREKNHNDVPPPQPPPPLKLAVSFSSSFTVNKKSLSRLVLWLRLLPFVWTSAPFFVPLLPFSSFALLRQLARLGRAGYCWQSGGKEMEIGGLGGKGRRWLVQWLTWLGDMGRSVGNGGTWFLVTIFCRPLRPPVSRVFLFILSGSPPLPISYLGCVLSPRKRN